MFLFHQESLRLFFCKMQNHLEDNLRHTLQRQAQLVLSCDQECEVAVSRITASVTQSILLLQSRGIELVAATRSCFAQAKAFHSDLQSRAAATLDLLNARILMVNSEPECISEAGATLLKIIDDARASPLCIGCGGSGVSVDISKVVNAISDLQVVSLFAPFFTVDYTSRSI
jgi:hypothetical protein